MSSSPDPPATHPMNQSSFATVLRGQIVPPSLPALTNMLTSNKPRRRSLKSYNSSNNHSNNQSNNHLNKLIIDQSNYQPDELLSVRGSPAPVAKNQFEFGKRSFNHPYNHTNDQSIDQTINQSINQSNHQSNIQADDLSNPPSNYHTTESISQSSDNDIYNDTPSLNQSVNQSPLALTLSPNTINHSVKHLSINQSVNQSPTILNKSLHDATVRFADSPSVASSQAMFQSNRPATSRSMHTQSTHQSSDHSVSPSEYSPRDQFTRQSSNESVESHSIDRSYSRVGHHSDASDNLLTSRQNNRSNNQTKNQSNNQSINQTNNEAYQQSQASMPSTRRNRGQSREKIDNSGTHSPTEYAEPSNGSARSRSVTNMADHSSDPSTDICVPRMTSLHHSSDLHASQSYYDKFHQSSHQSNAQSVSQSNNQTAYSPDGHSVSRESRITHQSTNRSGSPEIVSNSQSNDQTVHEWNTRSNSHPLSHQLTDATSTIPPSPFAMMMFNQSNNNPSDIQSVSQSAKQSAYQSTGKSNNDELLSRWGGRRAADQTINQSTNRPINQTASQNVHRYWDPYSAESMQSVKQSHNQSQKQSNDESKSQSDEDDQQSSQSNNQSNNQIDNQSTSQSRTARRRSMPMQTSGQSTNLSATTQPIDYSINHPQSTRNRSTSHSTYQSSQQSSYQSNSSLAGRSRQLSSWAKSCVDRFGNQRTSKQSNHDDVNAWGFVDEPITQPVKPVNNQSIEQNNRGSRRSSGKLESSVNQTINQKESKESKPVWNSRIARADSDQSSDSNNQQAEHSRTRESRMAPVPVFVPIKIDRSNNQTSNQPVKRRIPIEKPVPFGHWNATGSAAEPTAAPMPGRKFVFADCSLSANECSDRWCSVHGDLTAHLAHRVNQSINHQLNSYNQSNDKSSDRSDEFKEQMPVDEDLMTMSDEQVIRGASLSALTNQFGGAAPAYQAMIARTQQASKQQMKHLNETPY